MLVEPASHVFFQLILVHRYLDILWYSQIVITSRNEINHSVDL